MSWGGRLFWGALVGLAGGLIGLGGAEFRLPVLVGLLGFAARQAVPVNLTISFVTLLAALASRGHTLTLAPVMPLLPVIGGFIVGAMVSAFYGATALRHLADHRLERAILVILFGIGALLIVEAFLPMTPGGLLPTSLASQIAVAILFGLAIGAVSSLLGVAGGELIIPSLIFVFGADVKSAGTASILISLPMIAVGLARHWHQGAFPPRRSLIDTVVPMSIGSVIGAVVGGLVVGLIPQALLKFTLGVILIVSGIKVFAKHGSHAAPAAGHARR